MPVLIILFFLHVLDITLRHKSDIAFETEAPTILSNTLFEQVFFLVSCATLEPYSEWLSLCWFSCYILKKIVMIALNLRTLWDKEKEPISLFTKECHWKELVQLSIRCYAFLDKAFDFAAEKLSDDDESETAVPATEAQTLERAVVPANEEVTPKRTRHSSPERTKKLRKRRQQSNQQEISPTRIDRIVDL